MVLVLNGSARFNWFVLSVYSDIIGFEKAYCEYRLNRVESALKTIEGISDQTDKLKELYGQVVRMQMLTHGLYYSPNIPGDKQLLLNSYYRTRFTLQVILFCPYRLVPATN